MSEETGQAGKYEHTRPWPVHRWERIDHSLLPDEFQQAKQDYDRAMDMYARGEYTHSRTIVYLPGGMAPAGALDNGVRHAMNKLGYTYPLILGSSAAGLSLGAEQIGYFPMFAQEQMKKFDFATVLKSPAKNFWQTAGAVSYRGFMRTYMQYEPRAYERQLNDHLADNHFPGSGFNLGFVVTEASSRRPRLLTKRVSMIEAIMATHAVPGMFPPMKLDIDGNGKRRYFDGDFTYALPVQDIETFLGFMPQEILKVNMVYENTSEKSLKIKLMQQAIPAAKAVWGAVTRTPTNLNGTEWSGGIPITDLNIVVPAEYQIGPMDFQKREQMDAIFYTAAEQAEHFLSKCYSIS